jgi:tetratricopeptide (TPR) repeat protein
MKKIYLLFTIALGSSICYAQSLDEIKTTTLLGQYAKAKEGIDKYLAVEKNAKKPDGWFYKGFIYNMLSKDSAKSFTESSALKQEALGYLKKYREMDSKAELLVEQSNSPFFDIYSTYASELGVKAYDKKDYAGAFDYFKKALEVHDYLVANNLSGAGGFKFSPIDTILTFYTGVAGDEAKLKDDAMVYFKKMSDANIADDQYLTVYNTLADYYKTKKDNAAFTEILSKGRKLYPKNEEFWMAIEIENATDGVKVPEVFAKYEQLAANHPTNYNIHFNYSVELSNYIRSLETTTTNTDEYKTKLVETLKKTIGLQSTVEANYLLASYLYNHSIDLSDEARKLKGPKPDDLKKKKELNASATKFMDESIPYAQAAVNAFPAITKPKSSQKSNFKQALVILKNIYEVKKDAVKVADFEKQIAAAE